MKTILTLSITAAALCLSTLTAAENTINLSTVKPVFSAQINEKNAAPAKGAKMTVTSDGIVMDYVFPSKGHDACMVEFPVNQGAFTQVSVTLTAAQAGHRPFIVITDKNNEKHYFSLINTNHIKSQCIKRAGKQTLTTPIKIKNSHPGEYFAFRWGGDDNQTIDFPVKSVMLGINDYPDTSTESGKITFHSITFK